MIVVNRRRHEAGIRIDPHDDEFITRRNLIEKTRIDRIQVTGEMRVSVAQRQHVTGILKVCNESFSGIDGWKTGAVSRRLRWPEGREHTNREEEPELCGKHVV